MLQYEAVMPDDSFFRAPSHEALLLAIRDVYDPEMAKACIDMPNREAAWEYANQVSQRLLKRHKVDISVYDMHSLFMSLTRLGFIRSYNATTDSIHPPDPGLVFGPARPQPLSRTPVEVELQEQSRIASKRSNKDTQG